MVESESGLLLERPEWPVTERVRAAITGRAGGVSQPPFDSLNLATHVGDDPAAVATNCQRLRQGLQLPAEPLWLDQVHGRSVVELSGGEPSAPAADGAITRQPGVVCAVLTADCLPLLLASRNGEVVAALHAGWRGLAEGVIEEGVARMSATGVSPGSICAWLGPAIGPDHFEVGEEVRERFIGDDPAAATAFTESRPGHFMADIYQLARLRLSGLGVGWSGGGGGCSYCDQAGCFSYRRQPRTGRIASLIWIDH